MMFAYAEAQIEMLIVIGTKEVLCIYASQTVRDYDSLKGLLMTQMKG